MRDLGGDARVGELARIWVSSEPLGGRGGVVQDRRPELLVVGEHPATEEERVDFGQQVETVGPGVHPVGLAVGAEDVAVEGDLHRGDEGS